MRAASRFFASVVFLVVVAGTLAAAQGAEPANGPQRAARLDVTISVRLDYLLYLPENYDTQESWPLLLFLHGGGERGDDLELVKRHGPPKLIEEGKSFPFVVVSPQCPKDKWWQPLELTALLDEIVAGHKIDEDRIYVTGLSMGGFGSWSLAAHTPNRFAAIVPVCGGGEVYWTRSFPQLPVWMFHGAKDVLVPLERSQEMNEAMKSEGGDAQLTVYPETGHDAWKETYANPQLYEWLLQQNRNKQGASK